MAIAIAIPASSQVIDSSPAFNKYYGFTIGETAGATAKVRVRETSQTGKIIDTVRLSANESTREWYGPQGIEVNGPIFVEIVSGAVEGSVRVG